MRKLSIAVIIAALSFSNVAFGFTLVEGSPFSDVDTNVDYYNSIIWMSGNGVIDGHPDGTFKPYDCVNRVELLKMLFEALELSVDSSTFALFPDTYADQWYAPYVRTARERGTVDGYPDGTFKPGQCVNRVEAVKMAVNEFSVDPVNDDRPFYGSFADTFSDVYKSEWYYIYLDHALLANALGDKHVSVSSNETMFLPSFSMNRNEVAEMLFRMKALKDNSVDAYVNGLKPDLLAYASYGFIEGSLSYPSEGIPDDMMVCATNVTTLEETCTTKRLVNSKYTYGVGYKLGLMPGDYYVFAALPDRIYEAYYSEYMLCDPSVDLCENHDPISVTVDTKQLVTGVDPGDWYVF